MCSVSVFVGPWVCAPAFVRFVLYLIVFVAFPLKFMVPRERLGLQRLALERHNCEGREETTKKREANKKNWSGWVCNGWFLGSGWVCNESSLLQKVWSPGSL